MKATLLLLLVCFGLVQSQARAEGVDVTLTFVNVNNKGHEIFYSIYNSQDSYNNLNNETISGKITAAAGNTVTVLHNVNPGSYSLTCFHDENGNGKLDYLFGIPKEQVGFSNVSHKVTSKPTWDDVRFDVKLGESNAQTIYLVKYL